MDAKTKLELIKEALHDCRDGKFSDLSFVIIIGTIVDPPKITADDITWALEKLNSLNKTTETPV